MKIPCPDTEYTFIFWKNGARTVERLAYDETLANGRYQFFNLRYGSSLTMSPARFDYLMNKCSSPAYPPRQIVKNEPKEEPLPKPEEKEETYEGSVQEIVDELGALMGLSAEEKFTVAAKTGLNVNDVIDAGKKFLREEIPSGNPMQTIENVKFAFSAIPQAEELRKKGEENYERRKRTQAAF